MNLENIPKLTKEQAAIIGAYTGIVVGPFADVHEVIEKTLNRPVFSHELASKDLHSEVKAKLLPKLKEICFNFYGD